MITNSEKAAQLTNLLNHTRYGARDQSLSDESYEWVSDLLKRLRRDPSDMAIELIVDEIHGEFSPETR